MIPTRPAGNLEKTRGAWSPWNTGGSSELGPFYCDGQSDSVMMVAIRNTPLAIGVHPSEGTVLLLGFLEGMVGVH